MTAQGRNRAGARGQTAFDPLIHRYGFFGVGLDAQGAGDGGIVIVAAVAPANRQVFDQIERGGRQDRGRGSQHDDDEGEEESCHPQVKTDIGGKVGFLSDPAKLVGIQVGKSHEKRQGSNEGEQGKRVAAGVVQQEG